MPAILPLLSATKDVIPSETQQLVESASMTPGTLILLLSVFVLAVFIGFEIITKIPHTLHTPLMSGSNAISGIAIVGAILVAGNSQNGFAQFVGCIALILATTNVVGGFLVTHRMLEKFRSKK